MDSEFEKVYEWTSEKIQAEKSKIKEFKTDVRQSEGLIIGIIVICLIIAFAAPVLIAKYIFVTSAFLMFCFCSFYTFKNERKIISRQNQFSEFALSELALHIKDGFVYEKNEEISGGYYRKSGFNRIYKELKSQGVISGTKNGHAISLSNVVVIDPNKELFRGIFAYGGLKKSVNEIDLMRVNSTNNKKEKYEIPDIGLYMYAESIDEARKVVDSIVIQKIEDFMQETQYKFEIMLNKELIFFRFFDKEILTKPITNDKETKEFLYKYYRIIQFISDLIDIIER